MRTACSVSTMFGAEVPEGSAPTSWTTGFFMTPGFEQSGLIGKPLRRLRCVGGCTAWHQVRSMPATAEKPGRLVNTSAFGFTSEALIPKARRTCGVPT